MVNLYKIAQEIIKEKQEFFAKYGGLKESQYNKLNLEQWEEQIIEKEEYYLKLCHEYGDEPLEEVLIWGGNEQ
jgi:hypothetical protein